MFPTLNSTTDSTKVDNNDVSLTLHLTKLQKKISILPTKPIFYYDDLKTFSFLSQQTPSQIKDLCFVHPIFFFFWFLVFWSLNLRDFSFHLCPSCLAKSKQILRFRHIFVAFSEYMNFNIRLNYKYPNNL